jgi:hypothetical protein
VGSRDHSVQNGAMERKETCHTPLILLIINSPVKQILKFDRLGMLDYYLHHRILHRLIPLLHRMMAL